MNGWTPAIAIFLITAVFGAGGVYVVTQKDMVERPEFDAVVERIEEGQDRIEKDVDEIKGDVKSIEQMIQQHYGVGDEH